jgi:transcriptional regulator with XRE-family HTH domain
MNADQITGEKVHILLRRRGIQQQELADVLGIAQTSASRKILGKRSWTLDELLATAQFLEVAVTDLLPGNEYAPVPTGRGRIADVVRPKGLEPLTFWSVAHQDASFDWIEAERQVYIDSESRNVADAL